MAEVGVKSYSQTRKGKKVVIGAYTRKVGAKASVSAWDSAARKATMGQYTAKSAPGEEFKIKKEGLQSPKTKKEIAEWDAAARKATMGQYTSKPRVVQKKVPVKKMTPEADSHANTIKNPLSEKGSAKILARVESKIARFVEKYTGKTYKRML